MISYAQNAEDVVLARALPARSGFYVDVGAGHPETASVTKHFYDLGWHGINIDPRADAIALLEQHRPRDVNLQVAAGATDGTAVLRVVQGDPDLSTIANRDAEYLRDRGYAFEGQTVPVRTLDRILEENDVTAIDFLKIDVEGSEAEVLAGVDLTRWAPKVIVIECVMPWSRERTDASWRPMLEANGYREAGFDGINLFFAAANDDAVANLLAPASVLDDYETAAAAATREELDRLRAYIAKLEQEIADLKAWQEETIDYVRTLESGRGSVAAVAPVIDLRPTRSAPVAPRRDRPPAAPRLAVIGTPHSGDDWITAVLADVLEAKALPVAHPADVDWSALPDRFVIQLHWQRSHYLERMLRDHGVLVISAARHPLDVLLSMLEHARNNESGGRWLEGVAGNEDRLAESHPGDPDFLAWATSPRARLLLSLTPEWWSTPATHRLRYERLIADPMREVVALLRRCEIEANNDPRVAVEHRPDARDGRVSSDQWRALLSAEQVDALVAVHREVFVSLGYDPDDRTLS